uniref:Toprim domain-containing protein n=1 Tax=mine drainage metagenome TaxID=410659 RepID=E6QE22_9ZZZZ
MHHASGGWRDHRSGEHGNFRQLCSKLGIQNDRFAIYLQPIESSSVQQEEKQDTRSRQHARTTWARGIPTLQPKKPAGWAQAAWDQKQSQWASQREAVWDYLASRGLDPQPLLSLLRIAGLSKSPVDQEMAAKGADLFFMMPMYQIGSSEIPENLVGVQRTYLSYGNDKYVRVHKIGRAMLGKKGVSTLQAVGNPVCLPEPGPIIVVGEGFETVAAWTQAMHHSGVICWDRNGLKAWSTALRPAESSPIVAVLVDLDHSGDGQAEAAAAVRRIAAHEYGKAKFLLPPSDLYPDLKGNRDWADCLKQRGVSGLAFAAIDAWHEAEQNLAAERSSAEDEPIMQHWGVLPAAVPQAIAEAIDRKLAYDIVEGALKEYIELYKQYLVEYEARDTIIAVNKRHQQAGMQDLVTPVPNLPKLPPLLIKVTTGVGKSHAIRALIENALRSNLSLRVLTRTNALGDDYAMAGALKYFGRQDPGLLKSGENYTYEAIEKAILGHKGKNQPSIIPDSACFKYPVIELVAMNNHTPSIKCRECEHGSKYVLNMFAANRKAEPYQHAQSWFQLNGIDPSTIPSCPHLRHQDEIFTSQVFTAAHAAFSENMGTQFVREEIGECDGIIQFKKVALHDALVIVDEIPELSREVELTTKTIGAYSRTIMEQHARLSRDIGRWQDELASGKLDSCQIDSTEKRIKECHAILRDFESAQQVFSEIGAWLGSSAAKTGIQSIPPELIEAINDLHVSWLPGATARWEKAYVYYGDTIFVPLRSMKALLESMCTRTAIMDEGVLVVHQLTNLGARLVSATKPTILLDATPAAGVVYLVRQVGGRVVEAIARQFVRIVSFSQYLHGRTYKKQTHKLREIAQMLALREKMGEEFGSEPNTLTYMKLCEAAGVKDAEKNPAWGYFNRDDIGTDRFNGKNLFIFGGNILSPDVLASKYSAELMLMRLVGNPDLPDWCAEIVTGTRVVVGAWEIQSKAPLPVDAHLREWVLNDFGRGMAQALGRVRGVWAADDRPITIWIAGGLPLSGLAQHGLEVSEYREERRNGNDLKSSDAKRRLQAAVAALQAGDEDPTYRRVCSWLAKAGLPQVRYDTWKALQKTVYGLDNHLYRAVDTLLMALGLIQKAAVFNGIDISDAAGDLWRHPKTESEIRLAAVIILWVSPYAEKWREMRAGPPILSG